VVTRDLAGAKAWMSQHSAAGIEGVVVKDRGHGYRPGRRTWMKVRTRATAEAIVGGVLGPLNAPEALLLGRHDERGRLRVAGRTGPLTLPARRELGAVLTAARGVHPWPEQIPSSRFDQLPTQPVDYTPAEPDVVVEVDADVCFEQDRWRHATAPPEDAARPGTRRRHGLDAWLCIGRTGAGSRLSSPSAARQPKGSTPDHP
jgi:ATP-dependent DNA ligase